MENNTNEQEPVRNRLIGRLVREDFIDEISIEDDESITNEISLVGAEIRDGLTWLDLCQRRISTLCVSEIPEEDAERSISLWSRSRQYGDRKMYGLRLRQEALTLANALSQLADGTIDSRRTQIMIEGSHLISPEQRSMLLDIVSGDLGHELLSTEDLDFASEVLSYRANHEAIEAIPHSDELRRDVSDSMVACFHDLYEQYLAYDYLCQVAREIRTIIHIGIVPQAAVAIVPRYRQAAAQLGIEPRIIENSIGILLTPLGEQPW
jgi:hypothetical protein